MHHLRYDHKVDECCLFIDASKISLKASATTVAIKIWIHSRAKECKVWTTSNFRQNLSCHHCTSNWDWWKFFLKAIKDNHEACQHLKEKFPRMTDAKLKEGIFVGLRIRHIMKDNVFETKLTGLQQIAWNSLKADVDGFLGSQKSENYKELVKNSYM